MRLLGLSFLLVAACAAPYAMWNKNRVTSLQTRAAFDLKCPNAQLVVTNLTDRDENLIRLAGVEGCGHRGTYVWNEYYAAWFMDAASSISAAVKDRAAD